MSNPARVGPQNPDAISTVQAQLDAYNARDIAGFCLTFSHDAQVINIDTGEVRCAGHAGLRELYGEQFIEHPGQRSTVLTRSCVGEFVTDLEFITGNSGRPDVHLIAIYRVRSGKIDRMWLTPRL